MKQERGARARSQKALYSMSRNIDFIPHWGVTEGILAGELYDEIYALDGSLWYLSRGRIQKRKDRSQGQLGGCGTEQNGGYERRHRETKGGDRFEKYMGGKTGRIW